jgi:hypothetical protein
MNEGRDTMEKQAKDIRKNDVVRLLNDWVYCYGYDPVTGTLYIYRGYVIVDPEALFQVRD